MNLYDPQTHIREEHIVMLIRFALGDPHLFDKLMPGEEITAKYLVKLGLLDIASHPRAEFQATRRGRAHISQLAATPLPNRAWVDKNFKVIHLDSEE